MNTIRTDLAVEARELYGKEEVPGIRSVQEKKSCCTVDRVTVLDKQGEQNIGRPPGEYITIMLEGGSETDYQRFDDTVKAFADELRAILPENAREVMVAGLGNVMITPDSLGPKVIGQLMVTRHIVNTTNGEFEGLRPVSAISPGVLGITGIETGEILQGICAKTKPSCLIAVDALASRRVARLCRTVQLADTGIVPGSGVGNRRFAINPETMGIPVIAIGVPTVVDAATLAADVVADSGQSVDVTKLSSVENGLIVTPREIDSQIAYISKVVAYGINMALHKDIGIEDIDLFLS
jgi:spore protease